LTAVTAGLLCGAPAAVAGDCGPPPTTSYARLTLKTASVKAYYPLDEWAYQPACDFAGSHNGDYKGEYAIRKRGAIYEDWWDAAISFGGAGTAAIPWPDRLGPDKITLEGWVAPRDVSGFQTFLQKGGQWLLGLVDGKVVFRVITSSGVEELVSPAVMRAGETNYQHLVATFDGSTMRIYRNGSQIASQGVQGQAVASDEPVYIASSFGSYDWLDGRVDEVAVYDDALSPEMVRERYLAATDSAGESSFSCGFGTFEAGRWPTDCWRPYSASSPFNQALPSDPKVVDDSEAVVSRVLGFGPINHLTAGEADTPDDFGHPTYWSKSTDPIYRLHCVEDWGTCEVEGMQVRVPDAARPAAGSDHHLTVVDQESGWEYDLWGVRSKPAGGGVLAFNWGGRTRIDGDGLGSNATAAHFGNLAGIVRPEELRSGRIDHALFMVAKCTSDQVVYPAQGRGRMCSEMGGSNADAPPTGARLQLAMTPEEIDALDEPAWKKTILQAMAKYGMFVGDTGGGSWGIQLESGSTFTSFGAADPMVDFAKANGWAPWEGTWAGHLREGVDWRRYLRVIDPCVSKRTC